MVFLQFIFLFSNILPWLHLSTDWIRKSLFNVWSFFPIKADYRQTGTWTTLCIFCKFCGCYINSFIHSWLIDYLRFYVPLKNFSLIWRRHHCWWRAAKFRPMLGAQGLWAGRHLFRATPAVTRGLVFFGLIRRTAPFSRLLRHTRGCGGSILTRILTGAISIQIPTVF
jgi:hypothetical protein